MKQTLLQILLLLTLLIVFLNCLSNPETEIRYNGDKSKLSRDVFKKLDYKVKEFGESAPGKWHKSEFQTVWQRTYFVKRNTSVKESENT